MPLYVANELVTLLQIIVFLIFVWKLKKQFDKKINVDSEIFGFKDEWIVNQMKRIRNLKSMTIFFLIINFLNLAVVISNYYWANFEIFDNF